MKSKFAFIMKIIDNGIEFLTKFLGMVALIYIVTVSTALVVGKATVTVKSDIIGQHCFGKCQVETENNTSK